MNAQYFITKLEEFSSRYKEWWYPAFRKFRENYRKEYLEYNYDEYFKAFQEFETKLRSQNDLIGEIHNFIDQNYDIYLNATVDQQEEIRKTVTNAYYVDDKGSVSRFLEDLFLRYANERAVPKLRETGDKVWLTRGLVAMSLENSGIDYRDSILALRELRKSANEKNIDSEPEFKRVAQISSNEKPSGGSTPMSEMMAG